MAEPQRLFARLARDVGAQNALFKQIEIVVEAAFLHEMHALVEMHVRKTRNKCGCCALVKIVFLDYLLYKIFHAAKLQPFRQSIDSHL